MSSTNQYAVPRVGINELPPQPSATPAVSVGVIGIVGTFSKGPTGVATTCYSINDVVRQFGGYVAGLTGYLSALGAFNQGVNKVVIVRVASATVATAQFDFADANAQHSVTAAALSPGTDGNNISVQITAGSTGGTFKAIVSYKKVVVETFDNLSLPSSGTAIPINSQYIALNADAGAAAIPAPIGDTPLAGGDDGAVTADADYVGAIDANGKRTGLKVLETINVNIVVCAQQSSAVINQALITHCDSIGVSGGLRVAVLNTAKGLTPTQAAAVQTFNDARGIMTYPWLVPQEYPTLTVAPDGYYAGVLAVTNAWVSPSNQQIKGILGTERTLIMDDLMALTTARISPISFSNATVDYRIANGVNTFNYIVGSGTDDWSQTSTRREFDKIETEIWIATQWAKSQPITNTLMLQVKTQIDELLRQHRDVTGEIMDFKPTVCDTTNNTSDTIAARRLITQIYIRPVFAADFIDHNISRYLAAA